MKTNYWELKLMLNNGSFSIENEISIFNKNLILNALRERNYLDASKPIEGTIITDKNNPKPSKTYLSSHITRMTSIEVINLENFITPIMEKKQPNQNKTDNEKNGFFRYPKEENKKDNLEEIKKTSLELWDSLFGKTPSDNKIQPSTLDKSR